MTEKQEIGPNEPKETPEKRAESVVRTILGKSAAEETRINTIIAEAVAAAIADERRNCAKILDAIKDEFIDWCAINRISSAEQVQIANMLRKAAASVRAQTR